MAHAGNIVSPQILDAILNPRGGQAISSGLQSIGRVGERQQNIQRQDELLSRQQQLQQAQAQQKQKQDQEALFFSRLTRIDDPVERSKMLQAGLQSGAIDQGDFDQFSAIPFEQQNAAIFDNLRVEGFDALIPKANDAAEKTISKIREETRAGLRTDLKGISKEASEISRNFKKVQNLADNIKKGNRISTTAALTALVKLGDPGSVVSGQEVKTALNAQSPVAAFAQLFMSKGMDSNIAQSLASKIDPLSPENINVGDFLSTADALVSANVPSIQSRFSEAQALGEDNLSTTGFNSIFSKGLINRVGGLSDLLVTDRATPATPAANAQPPQQLQTRSGISFTVQ